MGSLNSKVELSHHFSRRVCVCVDVSADVCVCVSPQFTKKVDRRQHGRKTSMCVCVCVWSWGEGYGVLGGSIE